MTYYVIPVFVFCCSCKIWEKSDTRHCGITDDIVCTTNLMQNCCWKTRRFAASLLQVCNLQLQVGGFLFGCKLNVLSGYYSSELVWDWMLSNNWQPIRSVLCGSDRTLPPRSRGHIGKRSRRLTCHKGRTVCFHRSWTLLQWKNITAQVKVSIKHSCKKSENTLLRVRSEIIN